MPGGDPQRASTRESNTPASVDVDARPSGDAARGHVAAEVSSAELIAAALANDAAAAARDGELVEAGHGLGAPKHATYNPTTELGPEDLALLDGSFLNDHGAAGGGGEASEGEAWSEQQGAEGYAEDFVDPTMPPPADRMVGRYELTEFLGAGGMSVVYGAYDPELDRKIAVKLLLTTNTEKRAQIRLLREARVLAKLSHPNVVAVHDVGVIEHRLFVAMEFIVGPTLGEWLEEKQRPRREILETFVQAGRGLAAAHEAGLIHRDFKPDNVLVDSAQSQAKVIDFGIAVRRRDDEDMGGKGGKGGKGGGMTRPGVIMGTPPYIAPEQLLGGRADARSDQFSFCVTLYEGLYGESPYETHDDLQLLISAVCRGEIRDPPQGSRVPRRLRKLLLRGLSPDPKNRFPSMDALLAQLERDTRGIRRLWIGVAAAVGAAGGLAFGLAGDSGRPECQGADARVATIWNDARKTQLEEGFTKAAAEAGTATWSRVQARIDIYTGAWTGMHGQVCEAHQRGELSDELLDRSMACLNLRFGALSSLLETLAEPSQEITFNALVAINDLASPSTCSRAEILAHGGLTPEDPEQQGVVAALRQELANARIKEGTGQYTSAREAVDGLLKRARETDFAPLLAEVLALDGDLKDIEGEYTEAVDTYAEGYWEAIAAGHDELAAELAIAITAVLGSRQEQHARALGWSKHAMALVRRTGEGSTLHARLETTLGLIERGRGQLEKARAHHDRAVAMFKDREGSGTKDEADAARELGVVLGELGQGDDALSRFQQALEIYTEQLGPEHPDVARTKLEIGAYSLKKGDLREAREQFQDAHEVLVRVLGPDHPDVADALTNLGNIFAAQKQPVRARRTLKQALEMRERRLGPDHPSLDEPLLNLAALSRREKAYADAETYYRRALEIEERTLGPQNPRLADALIGLGTVTAYRGKAAAGVPLIERAIALLIANDAPAHKIADAKFSLAKTMMGIKRQQSAALKIAAEALAEFESSGPSFAEQAAEIKAWIEQHD